MMRILAAVMVMSVADMADAVSVYPHRMDPRDNPAYARRPVKPPTADTFGHKMQFMALRELPEKGWREELDRYVTRDRLGDIIWAHYRMLYNTNFEEQVAELRRRGLFLFDLWGFVPGVGQPHAKRRWGEFKVPAGCLELLERELGDHWLGMDNGEQDGRYVQPSGYARQRHPYGKGRIGCYLDFQHHFEHMARQLGNRMAALVSLTYGHHFLKEDVYTMLGAECAQALPNAQMYYSFVRGACKQYGVPWFGNVSVFNRWGSKSYKSDDPSTDEKHTGYSTGPFKGTSLALMKRLLYSHIFYNCVAVGFESGHYRAPDANGEMRLSPIGEIQRGAVDWIERYGDPGVQHVPVAVMFDFFSGWTFPRSLYGGNDRFVVWGSEPFDLSDHFGHEVFSMLYPGYEDSGFFRDERGFNVSTPYGDIADAVLSDAPAWMLAQYPVLVVANAMRHSAELRDTLCAYVAGGGQLVIAENNAKAVFPEGLPSGKITVIPGGWGVAERPQCSESDLRGTVAGEGTVMPRPHPLSKEAFRALDGVFRSQMLFSLSDHTQTNGLSLVTCRRGKGEYTLCIQNNTWSERPFRIVSFVGNIRSVEELPTSDRQHSVPGYCPEGMKAESLGKDTVDTIAGGGVRMFRVVVDENGVTELPKVSPPSPPKGRSLVLRDVAGPIKHEVLVRETFFSHYDSVTVGADYLASRSSQDIAAQANFIRIRNLKVICDLRPLLNSYPDGRLVENDADMVAKMERLYADIFPKMRTLGSEDLIATVSCPTEELSTDKVDYLDSVGRGLSRLADRAKTYGITVHVVVSPVRGRGRCGDFKSTSALVRRLAKTNLKVAPSLAAMLARSGDVKDLARELSASDSALVLLATPAKDAYGQLFSLSEPLAARNDLDPVFDVVRGRTLVFDAVHESRDGEYLDVISVDPVCLPSDWPHGSAKGLRTRTGETIDVRW